MTHESGPPSDTITVSGHAVVQAQPDEVRLALRITRLERDAEEALAQAATHSQALSGVLDELQVPAPRRVTSGLSVAQEVVWERDRQVSKGFRATQQIVVRLEDASVIGRLMNLAVERAEAEIQGPWWQVSLDHPARLEACRKAAEAATTKAKAYADGLGITLGPVDRVMESTGATISYMPMRAQAVAAASPAPEMSVEPGELDVSADVEVRFRIEGR